MTNSLHIMVVDDRPDSVLFLTEFLLARSHTVETCSSGAEALEAIMSRQRTPHTFNLLICDVAMPGMDGIALARELRRRNVLIPIALYTAYSAMHSNLNKDAEEIKALAVLHKPLELRRIENVLKEVLHNRYSTGTQRKEKDQPFFGTSRVARPATETIRKQTITPEEMTDPLSGGYALEPRTPGPLPTPLPMDAPLPPQFPPPIRTPLPFPIDRHDPATRSMPSFRTPLPQSPQENDGTGRPMNPKFRTPLPFLQGEQPPIAPPVIPPQVASAPPIRYSTSDPKRRTPPPSDQDLPFPTTAFIRRSVKGPAKDGAGQSLKGTNKFSSHQEPGPVTARIRRTVTGSYAPPIGGNDEKPPPAAGPTRAVACAHCNKIFMVAIRSATYTSVCVHCGQMNRIEPL